MALTLPFPTAPTNGDPLNATPILANILAIAQAIQAFDGSQVVAGTLIASAFAASINPNTIGNEQTFPFVASGMVWSGDSYGSTLNGSMTAGVMYVNGIRVSVGSIAAHAFAASKDTYVDIDVNGNVTYTANTNNTASPALAANSIRVAIIITGAGSIANAASVNQGQESIVLPFAASIPYSVTDSLGNLICPRDPNRRLLGYKQLVASVAGFTALADVTGLPTPVIVPTGRKIKITGWAPQLFSTTATDRADWTIREGSTTLKTAYGRAGASADGWGGATVETIISPTAGLHTYKMSLAIGIGAGSATVFSDASTGQAFIKVELE